MFAWRPYGIHCAHRQNGSKCVEKKLVWNGSPDGRRAVRGATAEYGADGGQPAVAEQPVKNFGELLRQLRLEAGLTQEELAQAAKLSTRSISDLERGVNQTARRDTARLLAGALDLNGARRTGFRTARSSWNCTRTLLAIGRSSRPTRSAVSSLRPASRLSRYRPVCMPERCCGEPTWPTRRCCYCSTTPLGTNRSGRCCRGRQAPWCW